MLTVLRRFLPFALVSTALCALLFGVTQQMMRLEANDLPLQLSEDAGVLLENGMGPANVIGTYAVEISRSLSPFLMIFGDSGAVIATSATLDGQSFMPPAGVVEEARASGENRITWQPREDVRIAIVVRHFDGERSGFILAGRSLRAVEERIDAVLNLVLIGWAVTLLCALVGVLAWPRTRN